MKKSVFEKRHGKITFTKGANWNKSVAEKHNISLDSDADLPAHIWHIMQNMHGILDANAISNISNYMANENRKEVRDLFLANLDYIYFAHYWGFFSNVRVLGSQRQEAVKMLKRIKYLFKQYRYKPVYGTDLDNLIVEFGGKTPEKQPFANGSKNVRTTLNKKRNSVFKNLFGGRSA